MKRAFFFVLIICLIFFVSCQKKEKIETNFVLGFVQLGSESGWRLGHTKSIQEACIKNGVELIYYNAEQDYDNQVKYLRSLIVNRVDVIIFSPIITTGWDNVLKEAKDANIPVIVVDRNLELEDPSLITTYIGSDFTKEGRYAGKFIKETFKNTDKDIKIVELKGTEGSTPTIGRKIGLREIINLDDNISVVYSANGDFLQSKGYEIMSKVLKMGFEYDVIYSHNDSMTYGVIEALEEKGINPGVDVTIVSVDGEQKAIELLKEGKINCIVECNPLIGEEIVELAKKIANGEEVNKRNIIEETVFTKDYDFDTLEPRGY